MPESSGSIVAVYGLGSLGLPTALAIASKGFRVKGIDTNAPLVNRITSGENPFPHETGLAELLEKHLADGSFAVATDLQNAAGEADVHLVLVPTAAVPDAVAEIGRAARAGSLVLVESTMPPGGCKKLAEGLRDDVLFAYSPERSFIGRVFEGVTNGLPRIVAARDEESFLAAKEFYEKVSSAGVVRASSFGEAELAKLFEGVYRDVNVALANELARACEEHGVDYWHLLETERKGAAGYVDLHKPGPGVGGHCIPEYPKLLLTATKLNLDLVGLARRENDAQPAKVVELVTKNAPAGEGKVCVLGLSYRGNVREHRNSPSLAVIAGLAKRGFDVYCFDPYYSPSEVTAISAAKSGSLEECLDGAAAVVVCTEHDAFKQLDWPKLAAGKVVVDSRNVVAAGSSFKLVKLGSGI